MTGELLHVIFGRFLLGMIALCICGGFIGLVIQSRGGRIAWWLLFGMVSFTWASVSATMHKYELMSRLGHMSGSDFAFIWFGSTGALMCAYTLFQSIGVETARYQDTENSNEVARLSNGQLLEIVETLLSMPVLASIPWAVSSWHPNSNEKKANWVGVHSKRLKSFLINAGGLDAVEHSEFVVELQRLDRLSQLNDTDGVTS